MSARRRPSKSWDPEDYVIAALCIGLAVLMACVGLAFLASVFTGVGW